MDNYDFLDFVDEVASATGFKTYNKAYEQVTFYGTSEKFEDFKEMVSGKLESGSIAILMDTSESHFYSRYTDEWYLVGGEA